ncbi:MAG: phosphatidylglycerophosphatase A [Wolbachia endosymbiont of Tyrophagus putrescentiae]|nr:phosphatidylglycerophosphatase A [Wolbachia endosymbiont of Tyrophagus putrescentiae]
MKPLYKLIATWMLSGTVKKMPGTIGSLAAFPLVPLILINKVLGIILILLLFLVGLWSTSNYIKYYNKISHDPKEVVIDEVVGQLLTIFLVSIFLPIQNINSLLLCFFSFRFFDIVKAWPTNLVDKDIKNCFGVMLDDVIAAIFASIFVVSLYCLLLYAR